MANSYLRIRGTLFDDMTFRARPGFESSHARRAEEGDERFEVSLLDAKGRRVARMHPKASERACGHSHAGQRTRISAYVPQHPDAVRFELIADGVVIHSADIPTSPPSAPKATVSETGNRLTLAWEAPPKTKLFYSVVALVGKSQRITLGRDLKKNAFTLDWKQWPIPGEGVILLAVSDGVRSSETEVHRFKRPALPPTAVIVSPRGEHRYGQPLSLVGSVVDAYGNLRAPDRVEWRLNGKTVAKGDLVAAADPPEAGKHKLALIAWVGGVQTVAEQPLLVAEPTVDYLEWAAEMQDGPAAR